MRSRDQDYCDFRLLRAVVLTWNAGASKPHHLLNDKMDATFFKRFLQDSNSPEILVFGFQELVDLEDKKVTASKLYPFFILVLGQ